jgi:hypothetical protein
MFITIADCKVLELISSDSVIRTKSISHTLIGGVYLYSG